MKGGRTPPEFKEGEGCYRANYWLQSEIVWGYISYVHTNGLIMAGGKGNSHKSPRV